MQGIADRQQVKENFRTLATDPRTNMNAASAPSPRPVLQEALQKPHVHTTLQCDTQQSTADIAPAEVDAEVRRLQQVVETPDLTENMNVPQVQPDISNTFVHSNIVNSSVENTSQ